MTKFRPGSMAFGLSGAASNQARAKRKGAERPETAVTQRTAASHDHGQIGQLTCAALFAYFLFFSS
jgi:hypothetical protein